MPLQLQPGHGPQLEVEALCVSHESRISQSRVELFKAKGRDRDLMLDLMAELKANKDAPKAAAAPAAEPAKPVPLQPVAQ